ncbi:hypothetical protein Efla_002414 [Eimeria flavescens]
MRASPPATALLLQAVRSDPHHHQHRGFDSRVRRASESFDRRGEEAPLEPLCARHAHSRFPHSRYLCEARKESEVTALKQRIASLENNERTLLLDLQKKDALVQASVEAARGSGDGLKSLLRQAPPPPPAVALRELSDPALQTGIVAGCPPIDEVTLRELRDLQQQREGLEAWQRQKESQNEGAQIASLKSQLAAAKLAVQEAEHQKTRLKQRISEIEADTIKYKTREAQQHDFTVNELIRKLKAAKVRLSQMKSERADIEKEMQRLRQAAASKSHEADAARMQLETRDSEAETLRMECQRLKQQIQHEQAAREAQHMETQRLSQALEAVQHEASETHRAMTAASQAAAADWEGRLKALQQEAAHQQEETQRQAAEERRRALEALREELRCLHTQEVDLLRAQLMQRAEDVEKVTRHCKTLTQKLEETASHVERLKAISRRDKIHIGEMEGRLQGLREEHGAQQQQLSLQQQHLTLLQQEKECFLKDAEVAQHRDHKHYQKLQETQRALETAEALARALEQEKQGLCVSLTQLQTENAKVAEEAATYRGRLVDLWRCLSSVCPAAQALESFAGSSCPAVLWTIPLKELQSCIETAVEQACSERERAVKHRADDQLRLMEDEKISLEARLASREEELQSSRSLVRTLEAKAAEAEKQTALFCEDRLAAVQQQLQQARRQYERELLESKSMAAAERQQLEERLREEYGLRQAATHALPIPPREHETETRRLRQQLREMEEKTEADGQCMRARVAAAQQEAGALRGEVQQLCLEVETLQTEKQRLHEAIASVESDSRAMHGIFRRHLQTAVILLLRPGSSKEEELLVLPREKEGQTCSNNCLLCAAANVRLLPAASAGRLSPRCLTPSLHASNVSSSPLPLVRASMQAETQGPQQQQQLLPTVSFKPHAAVAREHSHERGSNSEAET